MMAEKEKQEEPCPLLAAIHMLPAHQRQCVMGALEDAEQQKQALVRKLERQEQQVRWL